jgi:lysozyme
MARGTDVHPYYQRGLNWKAAPDIHFAWVKVSDGGAAYSTMQGGVRYVPDTHVAGAKAAGIPVGGYHYAQLGPAAEAQADILVREVRRLGATGVAPMLDLEAPFTPNAAAKDFAIRFCNRVAAAGFRPAVYMSASFAKTLRPDQWGIPGLVIVIARYGAVPEAPGSAQYLGRYDVHQYSSAGTLPGSAGAVDLDDSRNNNHLIQGDDVNLTDQITAKHANGTTFTSTIGEVLALVPALFECVRPGTGWSVTDGWLSGALSNTNTRLPAIQDGLTQLGATVTAFETADADRDTQLLAAVGAVQAGDVHALADALIPLLPKSATADDVTAAIRAAFTRAAGA